MDLGWLNSYVTAQVNNDIHLGLGLFALNKRPLATFQTRNPPMGEQCPVGPLAPNRVSFGLLTPSGGQSFGGWQNAVPKNG